MSIASAPEGPSAQGGDSGIRFFTGTIVDVMHPGGANSEWRGLVKLPDERLPVYVRSKLPPADAGVGDDLHFHAREHRAASAVDAPDFAPAELVVSHDDEHARWAAAFSQSAAFDERVPSETAQTARTGGVPDLIAADLEAMSIGIAKHRTQGGIVAIVRDLDGMSPVVSWIVERYAAADVASARGAAVIVEPEALPGLEVGALKVDSEKRRTEAKTLLASAMPSGVERSVRLHSADMALNAAPAVQPTQTYARPGRDMIDIIVPYNAFETGVEKWRKVSHAHDGFMPRDVVHPAARARLSAAHEAAHAHAVAFGFAAKPAPTAAEVRRGENFADAAAIMMFCIDHPKHTAAAESRLRQRSMAVLNGSFSHLTGPACAAALKEARHLRKEYGDRQVPTRAILSRADRITRASTLKDDGPLRDALARLSARQPDWRSLPPAEMKRTIESVADTVPAAAAERVKVVRLLNQAAIAVTQSCFTPFELKDSKTRDLAAKVLRDDLQQTQQWLSGRRMPLDVLREKSGQHLQERRAGVENGATLLEKVSRFVRWRDGQARTASGAARLMFAAEQALLDALPVASGATPTARPALAKFASRAEAAPRPFDMSVDARILRFAELVETHSRMVMRLHNDCLRSAGASEKDRHPTEQQMSDINAIRGEAARFARSISFDGEAWRTAEKLCVGNRSILESARYWANRGDGLSFEDIPVPQKAQSSYRADRDNAATITRNPLFFDLVRHKLWLTSPDDPEARRIEWDSRDLRGTPLAGENLCNAILTKCDLTDANLTGTKWDGAALTDCDFLRAKCHGATFADARTAGTRFDGAQDLSLVGAFTAEAPPSLPNTQQGPDSHPDDPGDNPSTPKL